MIFEFAIETDFLWPGYAPEVLLFDIWEVPVVIVMLIEFIYLLTTLLFWFLELLAAEGPYFEVFSL